MFDFNRFLGSVIDPHFEPCLPIMSLASLFQIKSLLRVNNITVPLVISQADSHTDSAKS